MSDTGTGGLPPTGRSLGDSAPETGRVARDGTAVGHQVAGTAVQQGRNVAEQTRLQVQDLARQARAQAADSSRTQKDRAAGSLRALADELQAMGGSSGGQGGLATGLAQQAATKVHDLAGWLETREPGELLEQVRTFARRRPGAFLLGAVTAGAVAGRLSRGAVAAAGADDTPPAAAPPTGTTYPPATAEAATPVADDLAREPEYRSSPLAGLR